MRLTRFSRGGLLAVGGAAAALVLFAFAAPVASSTDQPDGSILVIAPHPDDDVIIAAGITNTSSNVTIAYMTNGDWCETITEAKNNAGYCGVAVPSIGTTRQAEAVTGQALLGTAESDLRFLGYPDGDLTRVWFENELRTMRTETYASRGLGSTDWHDYRTGQIGEHGQYVKADLLDDLVALIQDVRPDHVFTTSEYDRHSDHRATYLAVKSAIELTIGGDSTYRTTLHSTVVHVRNADCLGWPHAPPDPTADLDPNCEGTPEVETWTVTCSTKGTTNCPLVWEEREQFVVPVAMQNPNLNSNLKYDALEAHASQTAFDGGFILRWANRDEIFWAEILAWKPTGIDDAYAVDEGAALNVPAAGVLANDVEGLVLGPVTALLVSGVSSGVLTLNADGSFSYAHDGSETVSDSFTYRPVQGGVNGTVATVSITINPVNDAPVAVDDGPFGVTVGGELVRAAPGVLSNDTDAEGGGLTAVLKTDVSSGVLVLNADGSFTYTHDGSETTSDSFTYQAKDAGAKLSNVATVSLTISAVVEPVHTTGLVDTAVGMWYLYDEAGVLVTSFFYGNPGDYPFMGDWDGDGVETPGLYRQSDGFVYLRNSNTQGNADIRFFFGNPGDVPIAGDFNGDGSDTVSIYRPSNQTFYIINKLGANNGGLGAAEFSYVFGNPGDKPFVGDFDGDGTETVGLHRESTGLVYFRNSHTQGNADNQFIFGDPADRLIAGDWTGDGVFTPALFRPSNTTMYFRHTNTQGNADNQYIPTPANPNWLPISGATG
jgi:VCBS repeat-containing protein